MGISLFHDAGAHHRNESRDIDVCNTCYEKFRNWKPHRGSRTNPLKGLKVNTFLKVYDCEMCGKNIERESLPKELQYNPRKPDAPIPQPFL